ncbi:MAG: tRNA pseudouridine38-40 synthase [Myxococcota bacterium]
MRWRLDLEYDGREFAGWQFQPGARTVQGVVEEALGRFLQHPVRVHAAGRTDAGVHAHQQVVRFDTERVRSPRSVVGALGALLPADVSCWAATPAAADFDPRRWPHRKLYRYRFLDRAARSSLRQGRVWHVKRVMNVDAMDAAAGFLVGTYDFSSFRAAGCSSVHPTRTVAACRVDRVADEVHLEIEGTGFLRHMVRILAGTLNDVGTGRRPSTWLRDVVAARRRDAAGRTAPPGGLSLVSVRYEAAAVLTGE